MENKIKELFTAKNGKLNGNYKRIYNKIDADIQEYIQKSYTKHDALNEKLNCFIHGDYRYCPICNNVMIWKTEARTCSKECAVKSFLKNKEKTNLERYGVKDASLLPEVRQKMKDTNLKKYGTEYAIGSDELQSKIRKTNIEKYGVEYPLESKDVREKGKETCFDKYGTEYPAQLEEIQDKMRSTNLERYGVEHIGQSPKLYKDKIHKGRQETKILQIYERTGFKLTVAQMNKLVFNTNSEYSDELLKQMVDYAINDIMPSVDLMKKELGHEAYSILRQYGYEFDYIPQQEKLIRSWLDDWGIDYISNDRNVIKPLELDIYIPEHNLAIEFNGTYWHSEFYKKNNYHQNKTKICNEKGITVIHLYEYIFEEKNEIYKSIIKSKLGLNKKIYARKCDIREVDFMEENIFLNDYHLQGYTTSKVCYGLYFDDQLVTLCSFKKSRFDKNYEYELLRNCTLPNITVVGGFNKLINYFKNQYNINNIVSYHDASISFNKHTELTPPNYVWIKNNIAIKRYNTMKHKLEKLLGDDYDPELSETENMHSNRFYRIYDSGSYKVIY